MDIKRGNTIIHTTEINAGAKRKFSLMKEDYITLPFSLATPINFKIGDSVSCDYGNFEITTIQNPTYNESTGGYDYNLQFDAYYMAWKNKIFLYKNEASWSLTASLEVHMSVYLSRLKALGFDYNGTDYQFSIDDTVEDKSICMTYDNQNMIDSLSAMAEAWGCEWWITDNIIHFGRCEFGDAVDFDLSTNVESMTSSGNKSTYATRIYAFGSTRNIPINYRPTDESMVVNGIVQKRLMLPEDTPYIDAEPNLSDSEVVENVVVFDDIYPRLVSKVLSVTAEEHTIDEEKVNIYFIKTDFPNFKEEYRLNNEDLLVKFQSGLLNGFKFKVNLKESDETSSTFELIRSNESTGEIFIPNDTLKPKIDDEFCLSGFDATLDVFKVHVTSAENELKAEAEKYVAKTKIDPNTYSCKLMDDSKSEQYEIGQKVNLINSAYFESGNRQSRIVGFEFNLDFPYDHPVYEVGEVISKTRLGNIESQLETLTFKGQTYEGGSGSGVYLIRTNDSTKATNSNTFSALRSLAEFISKTKDDTVAGTLTFQKLQKLLGGAEFGKYLPNIQGGNVDANGDAQFRNLTLLASLIVPEIRYSRTTVWKNYILASPGGGCKIKEVVDNNDGTYTITPDLVDGEPLSQYVDDILYTYWHDKDHQTGAFKGFREMMFRVTSCDYDERTFTVSSRPNNNYVPLAEMTLGQRGNFTNTDRQKFFAIDLRGGDNNIVFCEDVNDWEISDANEKLILGKKSGRQIAGISTDSYSAVLQNIIMTGIIAQVDEITGDTVRVPINKGNWESGTMYGYYNEVSHNGALWLCINENGTLTEPSNTNYDWLCRIPAASGIGSEGHWDSSKTPYKENTIINFAGSLYISKKETSYPPIICLTDKSGNYLIKDDGYTPIGTYETKGNKDDWDLLLDMGDITNGQDGVSLVYVGAFSTPPQSPENGWYYYDITQKATFVYQNETWNVMSKDGRGITSIDVMYYSSTSITELTGGEWTTEAQGYQKGIYVWTKTVINYTDGTIDESEAQPITGVDGKGVKSIKEYYYLSSSAIELLGGEWLEESPNWKQNWYIFTKSIITYSDDTTSETNPVNVTGYMGKDGINGENGKDAINVTPVGAWNSNVGYTLNNLVTFANGSYIAKKDTILPPIACLTDKNGNYITTKYGYIPLGTFEAKGNHDDWQQSTQNPEPAKAVNKCDVMYYSSSSATELVGGSWTTTAQSYKEGFFVWCKTITYYSDGTTSETSASCISGKDGKGVKSIVEKYYLSSSPSELKGGSWLDDCPAWKDGWYIFTKSVITYTDGDVISTDERNVTGGKGSTGNGILSVIEYYLTNNLDSGVTHETVGWCNKIVSPTSDNKYLWNYEKTLYTNGDIKYTDAHIIVSFAESGKDGRGIRQIDNYYLASSHESGITTSTYGWTKDIQQITPIYKYLWNYEVTHFTDNSQTMEEPHIVGTYGEKGDKGDVGIKVSGKYDYSIGYGKGEMVTFAGCSFIAKKNTTLPPISIIIDNYGHPLTTKVGYIPRGTYEQYGNKDDWELLTQNPKPYISHYINCAVQYIRVTGAGFLSPSSFTAYSMAKYGDDYSMVCSDYYMGAMNFKDGSISLNTRSNSKTNTLDVNSVAGYTQINIRCYESYSDLQEWNNNYVCEKVIGILVDGKDGVGKDGRTGSEPRNLGIWKDGMSAVWDENFHDICICTFDYVPYTFRVKNYGATVNVAPSSALGDSNWEVAAKYKFIATDLMLADQILADKINTKGMVVQNLRTSNEGARIEIEGSLMSIFGTTAMNMQTGVDDNGNAILQYFNNDGRKLYDLGPSGISQIPVTQEQWNPVYLQYLGTTIQSVFSNKQYKYCDDSFSSELYKYQSKSVSGVMEDAVNNGKYFSSQNKDNKLNGIYADGIETGVKWFKSVNVTNPDNHICTSDDLSNLSEFNEQVRWKAPIYFTNIYVFYNGSVTNTYRAYWNGQINPE